MPLRRSSILLPLHFKYTNNMTRPYLIKVSVTALKSELAKRGINSNIIASLAGLSSRARFTEQLAKGGISQEVADVLTRLNVPF